MTHPPTRDIQEITSRSSMHSMAVALAVKMQQSLERQRQIWILRAEVNKCRTLLTAAEAALAVEEAEHRQDREFAELALEQVRIEADHYPTADSETP